MDRVKDPRADFTILVASNKSNNNRLTNRMHLKNSINNTHNNKIVPVRTSKMLPRTSLTVSKTKETVSLPNNSTDLPLLSSTQTNRSSNRSNPAHNNHTQLLEETTSSNNSNRT